MSLFGPIYVTAGLTLSAKDAAALQALAKAGTALAATSQAILDKLNEPAAGDLTPEQQAQVAELIARLKASGDALVAAEAANP